MDFRVPGAAHNALAQEVPEVSGSSLPRKGWRPTTGKHEEPQDGKTLVAKEESTSSLDDLEAFILFPKTSVPDHEAVTVLFLQPVLTLGKALPITLSDLGGSGHVQFQCPFFWFFFSLVLPLLLPYGMKITTLA